MYVKKYNEDPSQPFSVPSNYDGTALFGGLTGENITQEPEADQKTSDPAVHEHEARPQIKREPSTCKISPSADGAATHPGDTATQTSARLNPWEEEEIHNDAQETSARPGIFSLLGNLSPLGKLIGGSRLPQIKLPEIGAEELLLIGVALYLLLSKNGDPIAALIILALLFID